MPKDPYYGKEALQKRVIKMFQTPKVTTPLIQRLREARRRRLPRR